MSDARFGSGPKGVLLPTLAIAGLAAVVYLFGVQPQNDAVAKSQRSLDELEGELARMERDLNDAPRVKGRLESAQKLYGDFAAEMLEPLLGSWAMRAKSLLDPLAAEAGLRGVDYAEIPPRALPLPKPAPQQLHARRPVRVICRGGYCEMISFLMRVEKEMPHVALQAVKIRAQKNPDEQSAEFVFEWPAKGEKLPKPGAGGGK